jgi:hypothetical protein
MDVFQQGVENSRAKIHAIRPHDCSRFRIKGYAAKLFDIPKGREHAAGSCDAHANAYLAGDSTCEGAMTVFAEALDFRYAREDRRFYSSGSIFSGTCLHRNNIAACGIE